MTEHNDIEQVLATMAQELQRLLQARGIADPCMIGIHTGGAWVAKRLHALLGLNEPLGTLDISFYRDDFSRIGMHPQVKPSHLPFDVEGRDIVLVDDVLYTGRTIRAALNEIFDYGRPGRVQLAALIDRGGRQLLIAADFIGATAQLPLEQSVELTRDAKGHLSFVLREGTP